MRMRSTVTHMQRSSHGGTFDLLQMHFMINIDGMVFGIETSY